MVGTDGRVSTNGLTARVRLDRSGFSIDAEIEVDAGRTAALLGPNGAGKSSVIGAIAGLIDLPAGSEVSVTLGGRVLEDTPTRTWVPPEARRVGVVFQEHRLFGHMSVLDNVAFGPRSAGSRTADARRVAAHWIELLGVAALSGRRPDELSGGEAQKVAIARSLAADPAALLLDEPLAALDVTTRSDVRRVLREQLDTFDGPRLLVTHDPSDAFLLADVLFVIENGRITQRGTPDEIRSSPATPYVAALAGTNLYAGAAAAGSVLLTDHDHAFTITDSAMTGPVLLTVHPTAVSLHPERPSGSARNTWHTTVELIEPLGDIVRITLGAPVPMAVDVTPGAVSSLRLQPTSPIWAAVKATEIAVSPA
jgi:molybdate transport system ATP-binding protein